MGASKGKELSFAIDILGISLPILLRSPDGLRIEYILSGACSAGKVERAPVFVMSTIKT